MNKPDNDPLPSWRDGKTKHRIITFVTQVCDESSPHFVPKEDRIATFDNDGTLMVEKPLMGQVAYFKRKLLGAEVLNTQSNTKRIFHWGALILFELTTLLKQLFYALRKGITTDEYRASVARWIADAKHPRFKRKYTELAYQPMLEVLRYFNENGFKNYIVTGSTANFVRPWSEEVYQVPVNRIIGSSLKTKLSKKYNEMSVMLEPIPFTIENRSAKVLGIERRIAKRPIAAFGNSYGDVDMLRWTRTNIQSLCVLIHHTDEIREYKYSPNRRFGWGKNTLDYAKLFEWQVVDMKNDWLTIFGPQRHDN